MEAKGYLTDSYQITMDVDGFDYIVDKAIEDGGENTGTSPHGMLLGSIASCKLMVAKGYLDHNQLPYEKVDVEATSEIKGKKRRETIAIDVDIIVHGSSLSEKDVDYMTRIVERGCTMANILTAGGENTVTTTVSTA